MPDAGELMGAPVYDAGDERIGTVQGVYTDPTDGAARYVAVDTGWFGTKRHIIPTDELSARGSDPEKEILLPYSREKLSDAPTFTEDHELNLREESTLQEHYGLESYQEILDARQTSPAPTPEIAEAELHAALKRGADPTDVRMKRWGV